jgi:hypothetical protein
VQSMVGGYGTPLWQGGSPGMLHRTTSAPVSGVLGV